jgi:hypothetical protein
VYEKPELVKIKPLDEHELLIIYTPDFPAESYLINSDRAGQLTTFWLNSE